MGTAKTSIVLIKLIVQHKLNLVVTRNRLFAKSMQGVLKRAGFDFKHYQDEGFWSFDHDLAVVELESIYKLYRRSYKPFYLIVMDESGP
jgi:hypothetical protein